MGYILIALGICAADCAVKERIERKRPDGAREEILGGKLLIGKTHNRGMAMNIGEGRQRLVAALSVALTVFFSVIFFATLGQKGSGAFKTALALLLGGAYSNTYDRIRRGYVVDYLSFGVKNPKIRRLAFNLADFAIAAGAMLMVLSASQSGRESTGLSA